MATGDTLLEAEHLTKKYRGVTALNDVSFTISDGITGRCASASAAFVAATARCWPARSADS